MLTEDRKQHLEQELAAATSLMKWCLKSESAKAINACARPGP